MDEINESIRRYREAAQGTARLMDAANMDPKKVNKCADEVRAQYIILRRTEEGRTAIISLISHEDPSVRLLAASHSLEWEPAAAKEVLEELRDSNGPVSFEAEMTLKEFEKRRLSFGMGGWNMAESRVRRTD
jgi:hypothetical protein